ncbi:MAG: dTMP kinase [Chloroflexi bacterium]|nr:dTMP kinase [Chloroflexota bacterium]MCH8008177.1 dTMP kinase [Chloroflexota bacterium]
MSASFIVIEGIDGSGISTQVEALRTWCEDERVPIHVTKEPTDGLTGGLIKAALDHRVTLNAKVLALLFSADRLDHLEYHVEPYLARGDNVITDRYYLSEFAYQSEEVDLAWLREMNKDCRRPDLTLFLDVPVSEALKRWNSDQWRGLDRLQLYESEDQLTRVREHYLEVIEQLRAEGEQIEIIDATGSIGEVQEAALNAARPLFRPSNPENISTSKRPPSKATEEIKERLGLRQSTG